MVWVVLHILKEIQSYKQVTYQASETLELQPVRAITGVLDDCSGLCVVCPYSLFTQFAVTDAWIWPHVYT